MSTQLMASTFGLDGIANLQNEVDESQLNGESDAEESKPLTKSVYFTGIPSDLDDRSKVLLSPHRRGNNSDKNLQSTSHLLVVGLKIVIGVMFFAIILASTVFSKLTLVSLTERLRNLSFVVQNTSVSEPSTQSTDVFYVFYDKEMDTLKNDAVSIYWQLLVILIVPNLITFLRCLFFGFLGKTRKHFPWPKGKAVLLGLLGAVVEVLAMSLFIFVILASFPPEVSIFLLNGVFLVQTAIDIPRSFRANNIHKDCQNALHTNRWNYNDVEKREDMDGTGEPLMAAAQAVDELMDEGNLCFMKLLRFLQWLLENWIVKSIAFLLQGVGILGFLIFWGVKIHDDINFLQALIALPLVLLSMSFIWSTVCQEAFSKPSVVIGTAMKVSARYKSSLINSGFRLLLYPLISYIIFRYVTPFHSEIDPWCLKEAACKIHFSGTTLNIMIVHIVLSFAGYFFVWISCTMTLGQLTIGIPLLLSTPVAVLMYYVISRVEVLDEKFFPHFQTASTNDILFAGSSPGAPIFLLLLWIGEVLAMGFFICTKTNIILAKDEHMFLTPHYDSIFLEQHIILNRQVKRSFTDNDIRSILFPRQRKPRMIFICSTMYRENDIEMRQMLLSIYRVAKHYENEQKKNPRSCDRFESHIFFDGAINGNQIENFGLQLLSLLEDSLNVKLSQGKKMETPYGYKISWMLGLTEATMPFSIHFKDKNLVKPKKRWSQVMYMNYVINYRIEEEGLDPDNTFILTTDADIDFTADSAVVLLDMLDSNLNVAAVSARTHPKGHGPIYWYQLFDYAIGHWFQKPAEHILGSVLCSPGCFSVFRCSALKQVLEEYSTEVNGASEFLMKDMGEDRWLCTLIIKQGLRLEYCAISEDYTYCPTDFDEFFKQRRRWIPSTIANLFMLVSESGIITKGNDSISILYIMFQAVMIFSTAIAPATVVLVISAGLQTFHVPTYASVTVFFTVGVVYGLICLYASPKAQLDVAKFLTFVFAIIMALVVVGIFKDFVNSVIPSPSQKILAPVDCSRLKGIVNGTKAYEDCVMQHDFASMLNNSVLESFQLPVTPTVVYIGALSVTFFLAGVLHLNEIGCLFHSIWFLLALPSGYLLLLIYSAANLCDRSWGTREQSSGTDEGVWGWRKNVIKACTMVTALRCCVWCYGGGGSDNKKGADVLEIVKVEGNEQKLRERIESEAKFGGDRSEDAEDKIDGDQLDLKSVVRHAVLDDEMKQWLTHIDCDMYLENFEMHGYTNYHFIASMTPEDFVAIGISKRGYRLRLQREIKMLAPLPLQHGNPHDVRDWLRSIELEEYTELFHFEGYKWSADIPSLKKLDKAQLEAMGVSRRAHLQRLVLAIEYLSNPPVVVKDISMDEKTKDWLRANECQCYEENFTRHGYINQHFIAGIKAKELELIGVDKKGFRLRLEKAAQRLPSLPINIEIPNSVVSWLMDLELSDYAELFHREGYRKAEDIVNLKELDEQQLKDMGISKRAHLFRLRMALNYLAKPSIVELNKRRTKGIVDQIVYPSLREINEVEAKFWDRLIHRKLKPLSLKFTQIKDIQKSLESLRNLTLAVLLVVNLMWIVLLASLTFDQLQEYNIDPRAFQLLFLAVYGFIIVVQFFTMLAHRAVTLIHYLGRVKPREVLITPYWDIDFEMLSIAEMKLPSMA